MKPTAFLLALMAAAVVTVGCNRSEEKSTPPPVPPAPVKSELPPGHPAIDMSQQVLPPGTVAEVTNPKWDVPASWQPGPASSIRRASYMVKGEGDKTADIAVTVFPGDVGGPLANISRWRGQLGLPAVTTEEAAALTTKLTVAGEAATEVDFKNDATGQRMIVITVPHASNSWFYKLTGDSAVVAAAQADFVRFVQSVKY